jgi:hypothetical protein
MKKGPPSGGPSPYSLKAVGLLLAALAAADVSAAAFAAFAAVTAFTATFLAALIRDARSFENHVVAPFGCIPHRSRTHGGT